MEKSFNKGKLFILIAILLIIVILVIAIIKSVNKQNTVNEEDINNDSANEEEQEYEKIQLDSETYKIEESEYVKKSSDEEKFVNESDKLKEEKNYDGLIFSDAKFEGNDEDITFSVKVKNTSPETKGNSDITVVMINSENMEVGKVGFFLEEIKPDEEKEMSFMLSSFYITTYDYKIIFSKFE